MRLLFQTLKKQNQQYKGFFAFFLLMTLILSVASVFMTRLTGDMGQAALDFDVSTILQFLGFLTILMVIRAVASAIATLFRGRFVGKTGYNFRNNFAIFFLKKPFAAFEDKNSGESLSIYSNDLPATINLVAGSGLIMIADIITLLVTFVYMLTLNLWLTLIFFATFPLLAGMQIVIAIPIQKRVAKRLEEQAKFTAIANDSFQNTSVIAAYSLEEVIEKRCVDAYANVITAVKSHIRIMSLLVIAGIIASISPLIIITAIAAYQVINGNLNIAEFIAFVGLAGEAGSWLSMLSQRVNEVQEAAAGAKRLDEHISGEVENLEDGANLQELCEIKYAQASSISANTTGENSEIAIFANNIKFTYSNTENAPLILDDVSFQIKKGSRVAFVGGSGSGKSTILKLLLGIYDPQEGEIFVMGTNTKDISLKSLRETHAYVPQDSFLFPETIIENITGAKDINDPRLKKACIDAGILDFILEQPNQFNTILSESAENISGGQKQRIALARAFYRDAPIILFDEATSALDPSTEAAILKSFDTLAKDKTVVMVAHRIKAISSCDAIIVMDSGKIVAMGTHNELLLNSPIYANIYESQQKEME